MYRLVKHTPLSTGHKYGSIIRDGELSPATITRMLESGTLSRVSAPPLSELPDWEERAGQLVEVGIITVDDLLKANVNQLAKKLKKASKTVKQWQDEVLKWLNPEPDNNND